MIVEEKKAAEFICPHLTEWRQKCEGSRCMAWRWIVDDHETVVNEEETCVYAVHSTTHGYCGLGGRP